MWNEFLNTCSKCSTPLRTFKSPMQKYTNSMQKYLLLCANQLLQWGNRLKQCTYALVHIRTNAEGCKQTCSSSEEGDE